MEKKRGTIKDKACIALFVVMGAIAVWIGGMKLVTIMFGEKVSVEVEKVYERRTQKDRDFCADLVYNGKKYYVNNNPRMRVKAGDKVDAWYCSITDSVELCTNTLWIIKMSAIFLFGVCSIGAGALKFVRIYVSKDTEKERRFWKRM